MMRRCPYCRRLVQDREFLAHRQAHWDQRRERKGSSGNWKTVRKFILRRDRYRCTKCGALGEQLDGNVKLEVHHVDGNWKNNHPQNLATLCDDCHTTAKSKRGRV